MRVLLTTDWYLPAVNGVVTSVINLQRHLQERGVDVRVLTLSEDGAFHREGNVYYLPSRNASRVYPGARAFFRPCGGALRELAAWQPDLVHSQCEFSTFHLARKIARICRCPLIHTCHTQYEDFVHYVTPWTGLGRQGAKLLTTGVCRRVQHVIVPSEKTKKLLLRYHVTTPMSVIPTGIEVARYEEEDAAAGRERLRARFGIAPGDTVLLYAGRLAAEKNLEELLELLSLDPDPRDRLVLVGDGPHREALEREVKERGLGGRVIFTGMISSEKMPAYYRMGDLFVSASRSETQGLTYFEAMASGLPLLCHADACLDQVLLPGENGFSYRTGQEFSELLGILTSSRALLERMGRRARETVESAYSAEAFAGSILRVYRKVLA